MDCPTVSSTIDEVTVYRQGARIRRVATLARENGSFPESILLDDLPPCLEDDSVRVKIEPPTAGVSVPIAGDLKIQLLVREDAEKAEPDKSRADELQALYDKQNAMQEKSSALSAAIDELESPSIPERPTPGNATEPMPSPTAACLALTRFMQEQYHALKEEKSKLDEDLIELQEEINHLQYTINQESNVPSLKPQELRKGIAVRLRDIKAEAAEARVVIEYMVPGARWSPNYSLKIDSKNEKARLDLRALISQATGEDWDGVALKLSTALPQQWTELPELQSRRIGRKQPPPRKRGWRAPPEGAEALFDDYNAFQSAVPAPGALREVDEITSVGDPSSVLGGAVKQEDFLDDVAMEICAEEEGAEMMKSMAMPEAEPMPVMAAPMEAGEPPPAPAAKRKKSASRSKPMRTEAFARGMAAPGGGGAMDMALEAEPELVPVADLMNYNCLRMAGAQEANAGKLKASSLAQYPGAPSRAIQAMNQAHSLACSCLDLPAKHFEPYSPDGFDYAYICNTPVDVPSRDKFTTVPVSTQQVDIKIRYVVVPREATEVFRVAKVKNALKNPLLPGPIDLYLDGDFFITNSLEVVAPKGYVDLGLGVDEAIKVARNTFFEEESGGMLKGRLVLHHTIKIEVINNLPRDIDLDVRERVPATVDDEEDIEVTIHDVAPAWKEYKEPPEHLRGRYQWSIRVAAGEKTNLEAGYDIKIAAKHEIVGGNRREV